MALASGLRRATTEGQSGAAAASEDVGVLKAYPTLQAFLRETAWDDGKPRETATLLIFADEGRWKVMLNDKDAGCVCFVSGDDVKSCLASVEKGLLQGTLDWRKARGTPPPKKRS